jgi:MFS family permease
MFARNWWELFLYRLLMGVGIGPKSATIPIYIAEVAPASIRGSLVMFWQVSTALGIMLGSLSGVALQHVGNVGNLGICPLADPAKLLSWTCSSNWRLMLASPCILPIFLLAFIYGCHESPRWLVAKAHRLYYNDRPETAKVHYQKAYKALEELSRHRLLAARDMLSHYYLLDEEKGLLAERLDEHPRRLWLTHQLSELLGRKRNRRAILASTVCVFAQQFW